MLTGPTRFRLECALLLVLGYATRAFVPWGPDWFGSSFDAVVVVGMIVCVLGIVRPRPYQRAVLLATVFLVALYCGFWLYVAHKFPLSTRQGPAPSAAELARYHRTLWVFGLALAISAGAFCMLLYARRWLNPRPTQKTPGADVA